nr:MAG TPA: hypothetical protein [Caudoviricetes sp.]
MTTQLFNKTEKAQAVEILNGYEKASLSLKILFKKNCADLLENVDLNVQGISMQIAKELFGDNFKSGKSGYAKSDIDRIFKKEFIKEHFVLSNTNTYALKEDKSWSDFKKSYLSDKEEALCKEAGKSFFKRLHDRRYQMISNTVTDLRNEMQIRLSDTAKKKKSLAEIVKAFKSQITNKLVEKEFDKTSILAELEDLKNYISNID